MRKLITMTALGFILASSVAFAQDAMVKGEVTKIDEDQAKITIRHDPIKKFDMDAMTMVFKAADPAMIKAVKPGDKIQFNVDKVNGQMTVTKLEKAK